VRYQELYAEVGQDAKLQEWCWLPWLISAEEGAAAGPGLQPPAAWHVGEGCQIRPVPPQEVGGGVGPLLPLLPLPLMVMCMST
jgi:hypothetical protein